MALALALPAAGAPPAAAQAAPGPSPRCQLQILNVDREGTQVEVTPGVVNYFAGGNVRIRCVALPIFMWSDSVASYQGRVVQFVGRVRYRDSTTDMTADYGTYFRDTEKWEARGNVVLHNLRDGSILRGPMLDYYRALPGVRDTAEMYADQRPTTTVPVTDSLGREEEPYVVVGDRKRLKGEGRIWAAGRVTIDRSDFRGRADSLFLDTGAGSRGSLVGNATMRGTETDSFALQGRQIDLTLDQRQLTSVLALDSARLTTADLVLDADRIALDVAHRRVEQTLAWGKTVRPVAVSPDFEARGDSLAFDTPGQRLQEIRAFGDAWLGAKPDSAGGERDWVAGRRVVANFAPRDTASAAGPTLRRLEAEGNARAFYRLRQAGPARPSLSYNLADLIVVTMRPGDTAQVDSVFALGVKDGVHLQPVLLRPEPPRADTTRVVPPARPPAIRPRGPAERRR
jgi:hypothetical protein